MTQFITRGLVCLLALMASYAAAGSSGGHSAIKEQGFFIGAAGGLTGFDDDDAYRYWDVDDEDSGYKLFAGYRIMRYVAIELAYADLGSYTIDNYSRPHPYAPGSLNTELEFSAYSFSALGLFPIANTGLEVYAQAGLAVIDIDENVGDSSVEFVEEGTGGGFLFALGARYSIPGAEGLVISAGFDSYGFVMEVDGNNPWDDDEYTQVITLLNVGLRYTF